MEQVTIDLTDWIIILIKLVGEYKAAAIFKLFLERMKVNSNPESLDGETPER